MRAQQPYQQAVWYLCPLQGSPPGWLRLSIECLADEVEEESKSVSESRSGSVSGSGVDFYKPEAPAWSFHLEPVDGKDIR